MALRVARIAPENVKDLNRMRAAYADRYTYADRHDTGVAALGRKYRGFEKGFDVCGIGPKGYARIKLQRR
jgi:hypothetical protein